MKKISLLALVLMISATLLNAQGQDSSTTTYEIDLGGQTGQTQQCFQEAFVNNGFGFGIQLNEYQSDFGLGLNVSSPFFANERMAFRLRGNLMFNEHIQDEVTVMSPYSNVSIGVVGASGKVGNYIKIYGEGGILMLFPSSEFSSEQFVSGGYGLLGVELFMSRYSDFFIEFGSAGTGAKEDKIATQPHYSNGFIISTGLRLYLK